MRPPKVSSMVCKARRPCGPPTRSSTAARREILAARAPGAAMSSPGGGSTGYPPPEKGRPHMNTAAVVRAAATAHRSVQGLRRVRAARDTSSSSPACSITAPRSPRHSPAMPRGVTEYMRALGSDHGPRCAGAWPGVRGAPSCDSRTIRGLLYGAHEIRGDLVDGLKVSEAGLRRR